MVLYYTRTSYNIKEKEAKRKVTTTEQRLLKMSLKERYPDIGEGWSSILELLETVDIELGGLPMYIRIKSLERNNGMLKVNFEYKASWDKEEHYDATQFIQDSITYRIERMTAKICEDCGQYGFRRTELTTVQTLCFDCYAVKYSDMCDKRSAQDV